MKMISIKRIACIILAGLMCAALLPMQAAAEWPADGLNTLNAEVAEDARTAYPELKDIELTVSLYKVGSVDATGTVKAVESYSDIEGLNAITPYSKAEDVDAVSEALAAKIDKTVTPDYSLKVTNFSGSLEGIPTGVYLAVTSRVTTDYYYYTAKPALVMLPWATGAVNGNLIWEAEGTMTIKPEREQRYGDLKFTKRIRNYDPSFGEVRFVFSIYGELKIDDNTTQVVCDVTETLYFTDSADQVFYVRHLPAGTVVTITEIYSTPGYAPLPNKVENIVIVAEELDEKGFAIDYDMAEASILNMKSGLIIKHKSIINRYTYKDGFGYSFTEVIDESKPYVILGDIVKGVK